MSCTHWEEKVALYAGGDLGCLDAAGVEAHLGACPECRELSQALAADRRELGALAPASEPSAAELAAVRLKVLEGVERRRRRWLALKWALAPALAGALVFALVAPVGRRPAQAPPPVRPAGAAVIPRAAQPSSLPVQVASVPRVAPQPAPQAPRPASRRLRHWVPPTTPAPVPESKPLVVKFLTDDPDVVIVWLFDQKGD